jgi:hypothetical protein
MTLANKTQQAIQQLVDQGLTKGFAAGLVSGARTHYINEDDPFDDLEHAEPRSEPPRRSRRKSRHRKPPSY